MRVTGHSLVAIVVFVTSELANADVKEKSGSRLLSEDTMFPEIPLDQDRAAVPAGLGGLLLFPISSWW